MLVVIGILIALQINNWNIQNQYELKENKYLSNFRNELQLNQADLKAKMELNDKVISSAKFITAYTGINKENIEDNLFFDLLTKMLGNEVQFRPHTSTFDEMKFSGVLGSLQNTELKQDLYTWEASLERIKFQESEEVANRRSNLFEYLAINGNVRNFAHKSLGEYIGFDKSTFPSKSKEILHDPQFENRLIEFLIASTFLNENYYKKLSNQIDTILLKFDDE